MPAERKIENNDIYSTILNMIKEINYSTDAIFTSNTLSDELGISRGVARETLIKLCQDGILKPIPRMGYRVIQLTKSDIEDAIQTRIIIESGAMRMILPAITEAELDAFIERVHPSYDIDSEDSIIDTDRWWDANAIFHTELVKLTQNRLLLEFEEKSIALLKRANIQIFRKSFANRKFNAGSHEQVIEAMKKRDADEAVELLIKDIQALRSQFNFF